MKYRLSKNRVGGAQRSGVKPTEGEARGSLFLPVAPDICLTMTFGQPHTEGPGAV